MSHPFSEYCALEIATCVEYPDADGQGRVAERVTDMKVFDELAAEWGDDNVCGLYTLYGVFDGVGVTALADFPDAAMTRAVAELISKEYGLPIHDFLIGE